MNIDKLTFDDIFSNEDDFEDMCRRTRCKVCPFFHGDGLCIMEDKGKTEKFRKAKYYIENIIDGVLGKNIEVEDGLTDIRNVLTEVE